MLNEICFYFHIRWRIKICTRNEKDYSKCRIKYKVTSKYGVYFSVFCRTAKLVGCLSEVEMIIFKFAFLLHVSGDMTGCLLV